MDTIFITEKLILHAEKEQLLGISFWGELRSDGCKLHTQVLSEPVSIKDLKDAIDSYLRDDEKSTRIWRRNKREKNETCKRLGRTRVSILYPK